VHPTIIEHAINAQRVVGLDLGAVGVIARDIAEPLEAQEGIVFGVQPAPDLTPFVLASSDQGQAIGQAVVAAILES
jgi:cyanophycin synthetase